MVHKIKKAYNNKLYFVIESDDEGKERQQTSFSSLTDAKKRALIRKDIMGDKRIITIEKILYVAV